MRSAAAKLAGEWGPARPEAAEVRERERGSKFKAATHEHLPYQNNASPTPISTFQHQLQGSLDTNFCFRQHQPRARQTFPSIDQITSHNQEANYSFTGSTGAFGGSPMDYQPPLSDPRRPEESDGGRPHIAHRLFSTLRRFLWLSPNPQKLKLDNERVRRPSNQSDIEGERSAGSNAYSKVDLMQQQHHPATESEFSTGLGISAAPDHVATSAYEPGFGTDSTRREPTSLSEKHEHANSNTPTPFRITSRFSFSQRTPITPDSNSFAARQSGDEHHYPVTPDPMDPVRVLSPWNLRWQRIVLCFIVLCLNAACLSAALLSHRHKWVLALILFMKSKDLLSTVIAIAVLPVQAIYRLINPPEEVSAKWILTLISAYSETEEQIMRTVQTVRDQGLAQHKQVMCIILDGKPRNIESHLIRVVKTFRRPYVTSRFGRGELIIHTGFMPGNIPAIVIEKAENAGKKDSIILCHDLFNVMRGNAPLYTKLLRDEIWTTVLPTLTDDPDFKAFDLIFCTDADAIIHEGAIISLADVLSRGTNVIAACGLVLAEMKPGTEWSIWHLYQQFQYTFGQYVRRRAEGLWGKVTCLPGCITMIAVRPEMAGAIQDYAKPVTDRLILRHQVQYLGTDRRLTYCMLSQDVNLRTLFVPHAVSETVAPQSLQHYLSQRRRWGSNAYFNDFFFCFGSQQILITRLWALVELVRLTLIYYRVANTILFIRGLAHHFLIIKLIPLLVVTQTPTCWYLLFIIFREPVLRRRAHKLILGFLINKIISPFLSLIVFTIVVLNLGNQEWGLTGVSTHKVENPLILISPEHHWTVKGLAALVRTEVRDRKARKHLKAKSIPKNDPTKEVGSNRTRTAISASATNSAINSIQGRRSRELDAAAPSSTTYPVHSSSQITCLSPPGIGGDTVDEEKGLTR